MNLMLVCNRDGEIVAYTMLSFDEKERLEVGVALKDDEGNLVLLATTELDIFDFINDINNHNNEDNSFDN